MPSSFFKPVGTSFIQTFSDRYGSNWGEEWAGYSLGYLIYVCIVSMHNYGHPKFRRSAPPELQVIIHNMHTLQ